MKNFNILYRKLQEVTKIFGWFLWLVGYEHRQYMRGKKIHVPVFWSVRVKVCKLVFEELAGGPVFEYLA